MISLAVIDREISEKAVAECAKGRSAIADAISLKSPYEIKQREKPEAIASGFLVLFIR